MSEFFDPARPGLPSPLWSHFKKKTQRRPIARSVWGRVGLAAKSGGFAGREESCGREFKLAGPVQSRVNAPVRSPRCFQKGKTLPPFSSAALSVNMKCWKSRSRQRLFAGWTSGIHVPNKDDTSQLSRDTFTGSGRHLGPSSGPPPPPPKARK